ncbi:MAG: alpha/beta fold hydrolase [Deltaproteobacteria bacterium]|nr:MAG: alpha/beta fold hydrolase [Deltaproteobacteria bacterium]
MGRRRGTIAAAGRNRRCRIVTGAHSLSVTPGRGAASRRSAQVIATPLASEAKHHHVDLGEVTLHWTEVGEGPPVLLLHGLNDSHRTWREIWPRLPGRRVLMLDLPGHGMSGRPDAPYTLDWNATQVARFIERLDLRNLDVVGHSYGGGVAQWLLLKCPLAVWGARSIHG